MYVETHTHTHVYTCARSHAPHGLRRDRYPHAPSTNTDWMPSGVRLWVRPLTQNRPHSWNSRSSEKKKINNVC